MIPRISVATVVYNNVSAIEATMLSVVSQNYLNLEYIVVDGGSDDGTLQVLRQFSKRIHYLVSENDSGVYHAMNKAIKVASGDWILFMNSGDTFVSSSVIEDIFLNTVHSMHSIIYGGHQVLYASGRLRNVPVKNRLAFWRGAQFSHQSAFIPLLYHKKFCYNQGYKIAADYAFFVDARRRGIEFKPVAYQIATIAAQGLSDTQRIKGIMEMSKALDERFFSIFYFPSLIASTFARLFVKRALSALRALN